MGLAIERLRFDCRSYVARFVTPLLSFCRDVRPWPRPGLKAGNFGLHGFGLGPCGPGLGLGLGLGTQALALQRYKAKAKADTNELQCHNTFLT